jgi:hypothetical protein
MRLHLHTTEKSAKKARKGGENDGKKDGQYAFIEADKVRFK